MAWQLYRLTYELLSPLHIGYHKVGNVQRTRYYVLARNLWAAVTERLTRSGFDPDSQSAGDYEKIGEWVKQHCAFSYFFVRHGDDLLYPRFTDHGLRYGDLSIADFERRWVSSHVTTALDAATTSAKEGSLHEVEFIAPYDKDGIRTQIVGWVFLDEGAGHRLGKESAWAEWLGGLQVGGERRYGFGRLRLEGWSEDTTLPGCEVDSASRPRLKVKRDGVLLAHTLVDGVKARGMIEPLVGRETRRDDSRSFGRVLTPAQLCWAPGSVIEQEELLVLNEKGIWCKIHAKDR